MIKFRAYLKERPYLKGTGIIVDVQDINYKYEEIVYENEKYMEVADFKDVILLQSTGLKDKNGVEIFEGDVVENKNKELGYIKWSGGGFNYRDETRLYYLFTIGAKQPFEVKGNIYEHPHLLKE
ncbi:YopX family protein [Staphylococcus sp. ZWU0021]|uniref:YopX family protein n=1 Tax=Staphylococcus sp. ZWU0021 TaxID=1339238 RepID=UPI000691A083|nr:YopX family protein [Staphylococcus sp. ZWU0021]